MDRNYRNLIKRGLFYSLFITNILTKLVSFRNSFSYIRYHMIDANQDCFFKFLRCLLTGIVLLFTVFPSVAQINIGISGGGNVSKPTGTYFRSAPKFGLQLGVFVTYHLNDYFALQAEPSFNISRIRTNDNNNGRPDGLNKGNNSLQFFNLPLYLKLKISSNFALVAGPEYNKLLNGEDFLLNSGANAFKENGRFGYGLGIELGKFYFRYRNLKNFDEIGDTHDLNMNQYQVGLRFKLL